MLTLGTAYASDNETSDIQSTDPDDVLNIENNDEILEDNEVGTFTELQDKIFSTNNNVVNLYKDYKYDETVDEKLKTGIKFNSITINGNNHVIDGSSQSRIFTSSLSQNIVLKDIIFKNAKTDNGNSKGGAIYFYEVGNTAIINCTFINNHGTYGGAVYWDYGGNSGWQPSVNQIINSTFIQNQASYGGAIYWIGFRNFQLTNSNFNNNYASQGSSIYIYSSDEVLIANSNFTDNRQSLFLSSSKDLKLSKNILGKNDYMYLSHGLINSKTQIIVLDNKTVNNIDYIKAIIVDDNDNQIALSNEFSALQFQFNGKSLNGVQSINGTWTADYSFNDGIYHISAKQEELNPQVLAGTVNIFSEIPKTGADLNATVNDIHLGENLEVKITLNKYARGLINVSLNNDVRIVELNGSENGILELTFFNLNEGNYDIIIQYISDNNFFDDKIIRSFNVIKFNDENDNSSSENNVGNSSDLNKSNQTNLNNTHLGESTNQNDSNINGSSSSENNLSNSSDLNESNLTNLNNTHLNETGNLLYDSNIKISNKPLITFYNSGDYYEVRISNRGHPISNEKVRFTFNGKTISVLSDKNGLAKIKIATKNIKPKTYLITIQYAKIKINNKMTIKSTIKSKKLNKIKKTTRTFKIKITLKGKKVIKNQQIKVKLKNKTYKLKTNNKGVTKFKINKKLIKKLKKGKLYSFKIIYNKDVLKRFIKRI